MRTDGPAPSPQRVEFVNRIGMTLVGDAYGHPESHPVLLSHGGGQTRHAWGGTAAALAERRWHAIAYDQRGHGESERAPADEYHFQTFAEDVVDIARAFHRPPAFVGASLGGLAGLLAQGEFSPGCLSALVLVDVTPRLEDDGTMRIIEFMLDKVDEGFASLEEAADAVAAYQPHRERPRNLDGLRKNLRHDPDGRWRWHWDPAIFFGPEPLAMRREPDRFAGAARALDIPTLLVRGRLSDLVSEETAAEFLELVPQAEYIDVSDAGHMVAGDRNDLFTGAVVDFLERHRAR